MIRDGLGVLSVKASVESCTMLIGVYRSPEVLSPFCTLIIALCAIVGIDKGWLFE